MVLPADIRRLVVASEFMRARIALSFLSLVGGLQAEIDSGEGRECIGSMANQSSIGSSFTTGTYTVGCATNHSGLIEVLDARVVRGADGNANGIADSWEQQYFPGLSVDPNRDPAVDGVSNLLEYLGGPHRTLRSSALAEG